MPGFRYIFYLMTVVWAIGLLVEATLKIFLAFTMPIGQFLFVSPIISYAIFFGLLGWSIWYGNQRRKAGQRLASAGAGQTVE
jgi:hypothetical protein